MAHKLSSAAFLASLLVACATAPTPQGPTPTSPSASAPNVGAGGSGPTLNAAGSPSAPAGASDTGGAPAGSTSPTAKMCGGIAGLRCAEKQYCAYAPEARCGAGDMSGSCSPVPEVCAQVVDEVCGCNDKTYANACQAAVAGVSVAMKGACGASRSNSIAEGATCGTRGVVGACAPELYCAYQRDCGATDAGGKCSKRPTVCTKIYSPVCGCDGKTYGSACTAAAAGMSVAHAGECKR